MKEIALLFVLSNLSSDTFYMTIYFQKERALNWAIAKADKAAKATGQTLAQKLERIRARDALRVELHQHRLTRFEQE